MPPWARLAPCPWLASLWGSVCGEVRQPSERVSFTCQSHGFETSRSARSPTARQRGSRRDGAKASPKWNRARPTIGFAFFSKELRHELVRRAFRLLVWAVNTGIITDCSVVASPAFSTALQRPRFEAIFSGLFLSAVDVPGQHEILCAEGKKECLKKPSLCAGHSNDDSGEMDDQGLTGLAAWPKQGVTG